GDVMPDIDISKLNVEQLNAVVNEALRLKRERMEGVPTHDVEVVKLAQAITILGKKLGIDPTKVITAIGRNLKPEIQFRAYAPKDPNAPKKPRKSRK
ncbi:MAG TPA: hypothetical protein VII99_13565, partial [Bacteroidia bacterium]